MRQPDEEADTEYGPIRKGFQSAEDVVPRGSEPDVVVPSNQSRTLRRGAGPDTVPKPLNHYGRRTR